MIGKYWIINSLLADFDIGKLDFKKRMEIFYCIAFAVRDLSKSLICHRMISPKTVAIIRRSEDRF
jgi:hypothetical protein